MQSTTKEKELILDNLSAEEICIQKYSLYADKAEDQEIKDLFNYLADKEKEHAQTLSDMLNGNFEKLPNQNKEQQQSMHQLKVNNNDNTMEIAESAMGVKNAEEYGQFSDRQLLQEALLTEKHVSSSYDNSTLESANRKIMKAFEHIQQEEHQHAQQLFEMMNKKGWYTVNPAEPV